MAAHDMARRGRRGKAWMGVVTWCMACFGMTRQARRGKVRLGEDSQGLFDSVLV